MFWISSFAIICFNVASRTLSNFPRNGKTPYLSRPTTLSPATASAFAESPSVKMSVHWEDIFEPASFASSNFGMPVKRETLLVPAFNFLPMSTLVFAIAAIKIKSTTPQLHTSSRNWSDNSQREPNFDCFVMSVSFVCESKAGFSIKHRTKIHKCARTWFGLISTPPFTLLLLSCLTFSAIASTIWSVTCVTWVPPLMVQMELTKLTCWNPPSVKLMQTSQRSDGCS
mmetsp:Transcript_73218/g.212016  ORF Transcript_73218/g.212016 Transcript_73218/m.212016 type:complete len:227 (-) Transcript_73218:938-1618(-)